MKEDGIVIKVCNKPKLINIVALQEEKDVPPQVADPKDKIIFTTNFHHPSWMVELSGVDSDRVLSGVDSDRVLSGVDSDRVLSGVDSDRVLSVVWIVIGC
ncbi:hypothetical protein EMCRGX_G031884 [Ephydatia muelleri]